MNLKEGVKKGEQVKGVELPADTVVRKSVISSLTYLYCGHKI